MNTKTQTQFFASVLEAKEADELYTFLRDNIDWEDGIYSKRAARTSRKAYSPLSSMEVEEKELGICDKIIEDTVARCLKAVGRESHFVYGTYVNYYRNGNDFCPAHAHKGQVQMVLSLGARRMLNVGEKQYPMGSGDCIVFGSSTHSIPIDPTIREGRISIAVFLRPN